MSIFTDDYGDLRFIWFLLPVIAVIMALVSLIGWSTDNKCKEMYGQDFRYSSTYNASCTNSKGEVRAY